MRLIKKVDPQSVMKALTDISGFTSEDLASEASGGTIADWRHLGMYVAKGYGIPLKTIGEMFGRHFSTVSSAERKVKSLLKHDEVSSAIDKIKDKVENTQEE
jgi:chromosomal replication initiation ATPase DnaA|tara:strand:- start:4050 stop:4355 length:306 start_codon:yes stop_codon:yes gene_type:complete